MIVSLVTAAGGAGCAEASQIAPPEHKRCGCGGVARLTTFYPRRSEYRVSLSIRSPRLRADEKYAADFREILAKPVHALDPDERKLVYLSDSRYKSVRTMDLNGKRVVGFELDEYNYRGLAFQIYQHDPQDDIIFEISYYADREVYDRYLPTVNKMLASIVWM